MSLYPGNAREVTSGKYVIDDTSLANSMAAVIEEEMGDLYNKLKGELLPEAGKEDRLLLFTAVARGVLKYLSQHQSQNITTNVSGSHDHTATMNITLSSHTTQGH